MPRTNKGGTALPLTGHPPLQNGRCGIRLKAAPLPGNAPATGRRQFLPEQEKTLPVLKSECRKGLFSWFFR